MRYICEGIKRPKREECLTCQPDWFNQFCPDYKPCAMTQINGAYVSLFPFTLPEPAKVEKMKVHEKHEYTMAK